MWLLDRGVWESMRQVIAAGFTMTPEQSAAFVALQTSDEVSSGSRILSIAGNNAEILIEGVLTKNPDFFALFLGGGNTTYGEIVSALAQVENNLEIDNITLRIDSPGGSVSGLFPAIEAIRATTKPTKAVVSDLAASAAYALAAQADTIVAENPMAQFGSVGIVARFFVSEDEIEIASTEAPNKAPDVTTEAGAAVIRDQLDAIHKVFVEQIAAGRGVSEDKVNAEFGRGAVVTAEDAVSRGMIDSVSGSSTAAINNEGSKGARTSSEPGAKKMDLAELKAEHSNVYAEAMALGVAQERERVLAHTIMGESFDAMDIAAKHIKEGSDMGPVAQAEYMTAGRNAADLAATADDDASAADATASTSAPAADKAEHEATQVADEMDALLGIDTHAKA